ncbi:MAG: regulatory protein MerR [Frankiales bacterium]|nr:regulatory protein MerR [Frankiales bacterium]
MQNGSNPVQRLSELRPATHDEDVDSNQDGPGPDEDVPLGEVRLSDVSRLLGVPMPTLRSWELRYGIPATDRAPGRHRRYAAAELHALRLMRDEIARGMRAGAAAHSVRSVLGLTGRAAELVSGFLDAAMRGDPSAIREQLDRAHRELGLPACVDDVLLPAMRQIGSWWQAGQCDVEQERLTTETARAWLDRVAAAAPPSTHGRPIVLACGPTDLHTLGLEALAMLLRHQRWSCRVLGARASVVALVTAIQASGAVGVVVASHLKTGRRRAVESIHAADALGVQVFYAGNAFGSESNRRQVPGRYLGVRVQDACRLIDAALTPIADA